MEQELGKKIDWVSADFTYDQLINGTANIPGYRTNAVCLPNSRQRFCTEQLKIYPIFKYCFTHYYGSMDDIILMNIGLRFDEQRRVNQWNCDKDKITYSNKCLLNNKRHQYISSEWRISQFPLNEEKITKRDVIQYWENKRWVFPEISNCDFCFFHTQKQQQQQSFNYPERLSWWIEIEKNSGKTFSKRSLDDIIFSQTILPVFGEDMPCSCTD